MFELIGEILLEGGLKRAVKLPGTTRIWLCRFLTAKTKDFKYCYTGPESTFLGILIWFISILLIVS